MNVDDVIELLKQGDLSYKIITPFKINIGDSKHIELNVFGAEVTDEKLGDTLRYKNDDIEQMVNEL